MVLPSMVKERVPPTGTLSALQTKCSPFTSACGKKCALTATYALPVTSPPDTRQRNRAKSRRLTCVEAVLSMGKSCCQLGSPAVLSFMSSGLMYGKMSAAFRHHDIYFGGHRL